MVIPAAEVSVNSQSEMWYNLQDCAGNHARHARHAAIRSGASRDAAV